MEDVSGATSSPKNVNEKLVLWWRFRRVRPDGAAVCADLTAGRGKTEQQGRAIQIRGSFTSRSAASFFSLHVICRLMWTWKCFPQFISYGWHHPVLVFRENEPMRSIASVGSTCLWMSHLFPPGDRRGSSQVCVCVCVCSDKVTKAGLLRSQIKCSFYSLLIWTNCWDEVETNSIRIHVKSKADRNNSKSS